MNLKNHIAHEMVSWEFKTDPCNSASGYKFRTVGFGYDVQGRTKIVTERYYGNTREESLDKCKDSVRQRIIDDESISKGTEKVTLLKEEL